MGTGMRRLFSLGGLFFGLVFMAPVIWFFVYKNQHPEASPGLEVSIFFGLVALIGLNLALRSLWILIRGV